MSHPIQIILTRQLAGYLSVPTFLVDPNGTLLFYNEPAEVLLGRRFDETGAMPAEEWSTIFAPVDQEGQPIPPAELALMIALHERRPAHEELFIRGLNGVRRHLEVVAIPILGKASFSVQSPCSGSSVNNARDALRNSWLDTYAWT
jgi:PAS domain-containing protein